MKTDMEATLVIPLWRHGKFWPLAMPDGIHALHWVTKIWAFRSKMKKESEGESSILTDTFQSYLALHLKGHESNTWEASYRKQNCMNYIFGVNCKVCRWND